VNGVVLGDGDGTVPLLSLGVLCIDHWRTKALNPHGVKARPVMISFLRLLSEVHDASTRVFARAALRVHRGRSAETLFSEQHMRTHRVPVHSVCAHIAGPSQLQTFRSGDFSSRGATDQMVERKCADAGSCTLCSP
jgi:hypothetical protein